MKNIYSIQIIYEDSDLIVINKPSGMVVNKSKSAYGMTVQEWAENRLKIQKTALVDENNSDIVTSDNIFLEFLNRGGVVHRLDKETSGILVIAKNAVSFENLKNQFKERHALKNYIALTHKKIEPKDGEINVPIGRLPWNRMRFGVLPEGRDAKTLYKTLENKIYSSNNNNETLTLVKLIPKTGRTHQIRVHLNHIGSPIFSDELYAGRKQAKKDRKILNRHFLHAIKLSIKHPKSGKDLIFEIELPSDLKTFLDSLESIS